ncbi:hypothetical protein Ahy_A03g015924 [Arachis hypogaea]|uniref:DNA-directed RNA polymerase III subunit RPC4 n=1 Tax=Arachis hypogaea TaxID=3818 RepID=A0A445E203_ARAHY|nr:hypothetical protein Ahy_A03g015924 [Arachis hypogaea]
MDQDPPRAPRKMKFTPNPPPKRKPKTTASYRRDAEGQQQNPEEDKSLLRRWNENIARRTPKTETKSIHQVAFGPGDSSSAMLRRYGKSSGSSFEDFSNDLALTLSSIAEDDKSHSSIACYFHSQYFHLIFYVNFAASQVAVGPGDGSSPMLQTYGKRGGSSSEDLNALTLPSSAEDDKRDTFMYDVEETMNKSERKSKREHKEPWDYQHSYYPTSLPLRMPYSGDPEFGEAAASVEYDENKINAAEELGLNEKSDQQKMILFKFPPVLPFEKPTGSRKGKEKVGTSTASKEPGKKEGTPLEGLPTGHVGKMMIYNSGAVKLKLGENLFDVSPGSNSQILQYAAVMNTKKKECCVLGQLGKNAVVTPDLDSLQL